MMQKMTNDEIRTPINCERDEVRSPSVNRLRPWLWTIWILLFTLILILMLFREFLHHSAPRL